MDRELFRRQAVAMRAAFAAGYGCAVEAFDGEQLTIVDRPATAPSAYTTSARTFGTGTVLSIDPAYRDFIEANLPAKHYGAMSGSYLQSIVAEGERRGEKLTFHSAGLGFALCEMPDDDAIPKGYEMREMDANWMREQQQTLLWEHGVGAPGDEARDVRNRFAMVLFDASGGIAAIAGLFDTSAMLEIGLDVAREHRGAGLAPVAVRAATRAILERGKIPFYACGPTNIRSQRTASASGFAPAVSGAFVVPVSG